MLQDDEDEEPTVLHEKTPPLGFTALNIYQIILAFYLRKCFYLDVNQVALQELQREIGVLRGRMDQKDQSPSLGILLNILEFESLL
jgi:hypothetical protein